MRRRGGSYLHGGRRRLEADRVPVRHQHAGVHRAKPAGQVVSRPGRILLQRIEPIRGCIQGAVGRSLDAGHVVAAFSHIVKGRGKLASQRIEGKIRLALTAVFLIDQCHHRRHGGRRSRGSAHHGDGSLAARIQHAVAWLGADRIGAEVRPGGREQREIGKVAHAVSRNAGRILPARLRIAVEASRGRTADKRQ